ncbi:MAG: hypothetical protein FWE07_04430 [Turicibacter sp.]|nr:hypothetical protein [Turicibacter sp.]
MKQKLLANVFTDGVILQRDTSIKFWGEAAPDEEIRVAFNDYIYQVTADETGNWEITVPPLPAGATPQLTVTSEETRQTVTDILMGDIWICSGQSNMELPMLRTRRMFEHYNKTTNNPHIRMYHVPMAYNFHGVQTEIPAASWIKATPQDMEKFSATAFFFANKLYEETGVPIGLVLSALGGTPVESWMSREALAAYPELLAQADECQQDGFMAQITATELATQDDWYHQLNTFDRGLNEKWYDENVADEDWKEIDLDVPWDEVTDLKASGSIWFRKEVDVPATLAEQSADIILGTIADGDEVYINGEKIGGVTYRYPPRDYPIPHLKAGKNTIAIRVIAAHGMGEFGFGKAHKLLFADQSEISLTKDWKYKRALSCPPLAGLTFFQNRPIGNYNGMIHPFHKFPIKGAIWYQGETNAGQPEGYSKKLSALITDWRKHWQQGDFPFILVQLANWSPKGPLMHWEQLRDEQAKTLKTPNTRMVVANDIGEYNDLHPLNKKAVGERLAGEALSLAYEKDIVSTGPTLTQIEQAENQLILHFETFGSQLKLSHGDVVYGLSLWVNDIEIAVEGQVIKTSVHIHTAHADQITAVSYAWIDDPVDANLYNEEGLPTVPFKRELTK